MTQDIHITPEMRKRAYTAAVATAKSFEDFSAIAEERLKSIIEDVVSDALLALSEPPNDEPVDGTLIKGIWADGTIDVYERRDSEAPSSGGLLRPWKSYSKPVWLTWELVLEILRKKGPDGIPTYETYLPLPPVKPKTEEQSNPAPIPPAKGSKS